MTTVVGGEENRVFVHGMNGSTGTHGHEVSSPLASRDDHVHQILQAIDADGAVSQRSMARELGIALGLTNLLVQGLVARGLVRVSRIRRQRVRYLLTPAGMAEKARMSRQALARAVERYRVARHRLGHAFSVLSQEWPGPPGQPKRIAFLGAGEVAEIGYICLQETDLVLAAVVDDLGRRQFFNVPVVPSKEFILAGYVRLEVQAVIIMSLQEAHRMRAVARQAGVPNDRVVWP